MYMRLWITGTLLLSASSARADHVHTVDHDGAHPFGAGVSMLAASFSTMLYSGNYQGVVPAVHWSHDRFAAGANVGLYRLEKNGAQFYGVGDVVVHGQVVLVGQHPVHAGVTAALSIPVGDQLRGMSMGHPMAMPALFGTYMFDRATVTATAGYSHAIAANSEHDHGMWPIVDPMNMVEFTWSAAGDVTLTRELHCGPVLSGGVPIGDGDNRVIGALRATWGSGRLSTAAELQLGLVGDPFIVRGVVSTALGF